MRFSIVFEYLGEKLLKRPLVSQLPSRSMHGDVNTHSPCRFQGDLCGTLGSSVLGILPHGRFAADADVTSLIRPWKFIWNDVSCLRTSELERLLSNCVTLQRCVCIPPARCRLPLNVF